LQNSQNYYCYHWCSIDTTKKGKPQRCVCFADGKIIHIQNKTLLPTYDIFDEYRYFEPNQTLLYYSKGHQNCATILKIFEFDDQPMYIITA
jgi:NAD+ synthase (glutamine-hydrolysing)